MKHITVPLSPAVFQTSLPPHELDNYRRQYQSWRVGDSSGTSDDVFGDHTAFKALFREKDPASFFYRGPEVAYVTVNFSVNAFTQQNEVMV